MLRVLLLFLLAFAALVLPPADRRGPGQWLALEARRQLFPLARRLTPIGSCQSRHQQADG